MEFTFVEDEIPVDTYVVYRNVATSTRSTTLDGPVDTYAVSRDVATSTRSTTLDGPVDTYVVSRNVATGTRSMTLDGSIHCSTRSKTLEFSTPLSHLRLLGCAGALCIVQGVHHLGLLFVQVYCTRGDVSVFCPDLHVLQCRMLL